MDYNKTKRKAFLQAFQGNGYRSKTFDTIGIIILTALLVVELFLWLR